jgi:23S rRNA (pseudouridine1915-N3)-methyltransferase
MGGDADVRLALVCVGKLKAGPERLLFDRYLKRLTHGARGAGLAGVDLREIGESRSRRPDERRAEEAAAILAATPKGAALVLLDEHGQSATSEDWAADIGRQRDGSRPGYVVVIGGPDGLDPSLRAAAHRVLSFGQMTWPHQLVRVMAGEQLYRAMTILARHPYHRG